MTFYVSLFGLQTIDNNYIIYVQTYSQVEVAIPEWNPLLISLDPPLSRKKGPSDSIREMSNMSDIKIEHPIDVLI